jgi:hypothetical protein
MSFRPYCAGKEDCLVTSGDDTVGQTPKIRFRSSAGGKTATDESDLEVFTLHQVFTWTFRAQYLFACLAKS